MPVCRPPILELILFALCVTFQPTPSVAKETVMHPREGPEPVNRVFGGHIQGGGPGAGVGTKEELEHSEMRGVGGGLFSCLQIPALHSL